VPTALRLFLKKLLAPHPLDRFDTADDALNELTRIDVQAVDIEQDQSASIKRKPNVRYAVSAVAAILAVTVLIWFNLRETGELQTDADDFIAENVVIDNSDSKMDSPAVIDTTADFGDDGSENYESVEEGGPSVSPGVPAEVDKSESVMIEAELQGQLSEIPADIIVEDPKPGLDIIADSVNIEFSIKPWASVYCDGELLGTTPALSDIKLPSESYSLRFEHVDFPPLYRQYDFTDDDSITVSVDLTAEFARLDFSVKPWGYLYIDDIEKGTIPLSNPVFIEPGKHIIRINHPDFSEIIRSVSVVAGETLIIEESFMGENPIPEH